MSDRTEFDDLAQRKANEHRHAFQATAWNDMEALLGRQRVAGRRRWLIALSSFLLVGGAVWWYGRMDTAGTTAEIAPIDVHPQRSVAVHPPEDPSTGLIDRSAEEGPDALRSTPPEEVPIARTGGPSSEILPTARPSLARATRSHQGTPTTSPAGDVVEVEVGAGIKAGSNVAEIGPAAGEEEMPVVTTSAEPLIISDAEQVEEPEDDPADALMDTGRNVVVIAPEVATREEGTSEQPVALAHDGPTDRDMGRRNAHVAGTSIPDSIAIQDSAWMSLAQDTAITSADTAAAPVDTLPLALTIDPRAPWEISVLGGPFRSTTAYTGERLSAWNSDLRNGRSFDVGAELMHMGDHFGVGAGLHYSTYVEEVDARELSLTETVFFDSIYFMPVNTSILAVVGTVIIDGQEYLATQHLDTTINVLVTGTGSYATTSLQREARKYTNRLSYVEIPLLVDAHLLQGPWTLGVRGGPTLGVLQGRRGALPNAALDGYTPFTEEAFRELVVGYTLRAYIRYRFSDTWSMGIEPAMRGQLFNALNGDGLERRSSAIGAFLSVNYRLH